tara:strand:+ start:2208 stop:2624 length:417 start_codon:yes stop_codon:yes gene_type:complete
MADLSPTDTSVLAVDGATLVPGTLGATVTAGQSLYLDSSTGTYKLCDANDTAAIASLAGIAMTGGVSGQPVTVLTAGQYNPGGAILTVGEIYCTTATPGGIAHVDDLASGWKTAIIGIALTTSNMLYVGIPGATALTA